MRGAGTSHFHFPRLPLFSAQRADPEAGSCSLRQRNQSLDVLDAALQELGSPRDLEKVLAFAELVKAPSRGGPHSRA